MTIKKFFDEQMEQSLIKSTIVAKYFDVWSKIIINTQKKFPSTAQKVAYIDLFAGPGRYKDGSSSTPLKILQNAIEDKDLSERLITIFNDKNENNSKDLEQTIFEMENIKNLKYKPVVKNEEVGENIVKQFEDISLIPTFFFVDPWGYKGLSLRLVNSVVKNWGCDAIFFFNYNRISMGINNKKVESHMNALFGNERCDKLRQELKKESVKNKELLIIEELCSALKEYGSRYVLPFRFKDAKGRRTSHHLIFVSKNFKGYEIMKEIMAKESTSNDEGVPSFAYDPADSLPKQMLLFKLSRPLKILKDDVCSTFSGQTLTMKEIYEKHNVDTPFIKSNYKEALKELFFVDNIITAVSTKGKAPRSGTFGDEIIVKFP